MELPSGLKIFDLSGKTALVTGGSRGLGAVAARALAASGARVVICGRTESDLQNVCSSLEGEGCEAYHVVVNVTDEAAVEAMVEGVVQRFGRLDILVNNAGKNIRKTALDLSTAELDDVLGLNYRGYFFCARAAGRTMVRQGSGRVINITSILSSIALPNQTAYASSKGAIAQLTKVLAVEWAPFGVTVNTIGPAYFETELTRPLFEDPERRDVIIRSTPLGRWGQPEELAGTLILLASDASSFITGQTIFVDGGWLAL